MKRWVMNLGAGIVGLRLQEAARPEPAQGEALVRVRAVSLNYREVSILVHGRYPLAVKADVVAASGGAGEVVAVGAGVTRVRPGMRVIASIFPHWLDGPFRPEVIDQLGGSLDGMLSECVCVPESALVPIADHLDFEEAACLPCAALTAWHALTAAGPLQPRDTVLALGSGAVSLFALQFAKALGAGTICTTSSEAKASRLRELGAEWVVDYRRDAQWGDSVRTRSGGRGVDRVIEVGGATLPQSLRATRLGGHISLGGTRAGAAAVDVGAIFASGATIAPVAVGSRTQLEAMMDVVGRHALRPVIDKAFAFEEAPAAFAYYLGGSNFGKVVIRVGD